MNDDTDKNVRRWLERSAPDYIKFTALYPHERANARTGLFQDGETWFWGEDDGTGRIDCWPVEPSHPLIDLALSVEEEQSRRERNLAMTERDALNREHNVITDIAELDGWRITGLRRWKEGVVQYTAFRKTGATAEQKIGYAKDEVFAHLQIPSQNTKSDS